MNRLLLIVALVCCGKPAATTTQTAPPEPRPERTDVAIAAESPPPVGPARVDFDVAESPMAVVIAGKDMVWTDSTGAIWTMPSDGSATPKQLSDQKGVGFAFHPVVVGGEVLVSTKRDFLRVALPGGSVTRMKVQGLLEDPEEVVADDHNVYVTLFKRDEVMAIPKAGGAARELMKFKRGVLAVHGATLYAVSYSTGVLVAVPTAGGKVKQIARDFVRPTALAVDDTHAFVYTERDKTLRRVELATGNTITLATGLENSDDLVGDGAWLYTFSWGKPAKLLRIAKTGVGAAQVLADDLASPYHIAVDASAIYVTSRDQNKIVRIAK